MSSVNGPPSEMRERILASARATPAPTRSAARTRILLTLVVAVALALAIFVAHGGIRAGSSPTDAVQREARPAVLILATSLGAAALAALMTWVALGRGRSALGRPTALLVAAVVLAPLALLAWKAAISSGHPGMTECWIERPGFRCLRLSLMLSAAPLAALLLARRGTDAVHPVASGAAFGAAAGAFSWVLVDLWCPVAYLQHLLLGHVLPLAITCVAGALLGWLLLRVRATR